MKLHFRSINILLSITIIILAIGKDVAGMNTFNTDT